MQKILAVSLIVVASLFILSAPTVFAQFGPCTADFTCDADVDADDVTEFLAQFGREPSFKPCPDCYDSQCPCAAPAVQWCYSASECQGVGDCCCVNYYFPEQGGWCLDADNCDDHMNAFICW